MAKKVRRKPEEADPGFEFPEFDETAFVTKESELFVAMVLAAAIAFVLGVASWVLHQQGLGWYVAFAVGILGVVASPFVIARVRAKSHLYTKSDWAGLVALEFFGWLALWFVLLNVT